MNEVAGIFYFILFLFVFYIIVYYAVKHAIDDSKALKEVREQLASMSKEKEKEVVPPVRKKEGEEEECPGCGAPVTALARECHSCGLTLREDS